MFISFSPEKIISCLKRKINGEERKKKEKKRLNQSGCTDSKFCLPKKSKYLILPEISSSEYLQMKT